jgi:mono/diheme cytochrome c family protein
MNRSTLSAIVASLALLGASLAVAKPVTYDLPQETASLRPGPGVELARNNCMTCHSVDYIAIQPPKKGEAFWEAEVTKMIKTYKAPIDEADVKAIADYLAKTY